MVRLYVEALPALQAREALEAVRIQQVGSGQMKREDARRAVMDWRRTALNGTDRPRARPATPEVLRSMGIAVTEVPRA